MSFKSPLILRANEDDGGEWIVEHPLIYDSDVAKRIFTVEVGFLTDLASVPRVPVLYLMFGGHARAAAVLHDFLYVTRPVTRDVADAVFREAMGKTGVTGWRAWVMWAGVRIGGGTYWNEKTITFEPPVGMG